MYFITHFRHVKGIQLEVFAESQKRKPIRAMRRWGLRWVLHCTDPLYVLPNRR